MCFPLRILFRCNLTLVIVFGEMTEVGGGFIDGRPTLNGSSVRGRYIPNKITILTTADLSHFPLGTSIRKISLSLRKLLDTEL